MTYDLHGGGWEDKTGHNSPLKSHPSETGNDTYLNVVSFQDNQAEKLTTSFILCYFFSVSVLRFWIFKTTKTAYIFKTAVFIQIVILETNLPYKCIN